MTKIDKLYFNTVSQKKRIHNLKISAAFEKRVRFASIETRNNLNA